jgi:hypothetical protein
MRIMKIPFRLFERKSCSQSEELGDMERNIGRVWRFALCSSSVSRARERQCGRTLAPPHPGSLEGSRTLRYTGVNHGPPPVSALHSVFVIAKEFYRRDLENKVPEETYSVTSVPRLLMKL